MSVERPRSLGHGHITTGVVVVALCVLDGTIRRASHALLTSKPGHMTSRINNSVKINHGGEEKSKPPARLCWKKENHGGVQWMLALLLAAVRDNTASDTEVSDIGLY